MVAAAVVLLPGCGGDGTALRDQPALEGFPERDIVDVIERDEQMDVDHGSVQDTAETYQYALLFKGSCRDLYELYDRLIRTGDLGPRPSVREVPHPVAAAVDITEKIIDELYDLLAAGDVEAARKRLADEREGCGRVPVSATGERTTTIGDAVQP